QLDVPKIILSRFDFRKLFYYQVIVAGRVEAENMHIQAYNNKRYPPSTKVPLTPMQLLFSFKSYLNIDTLHLKNFNANYDELQMNGDEPGKATFNNLSVIITNLTNDPVRIKKNPLCIMEISGLLFAKAAIDIKMIFFLNDRKGKFTLNASVNDFDPKIFNSMITPVSNGKIVSGNVRKAIVAMNGNNNNITGTLELYYNNLQLDFADPNSSKLKSKAMSIAANIAIVNDNPTEKYPFRYGAIAYTRSSNQAIFNYIWKAIFESIKSVVMQKGENKKRNNK
ncbi:MAG: hypothetical protein LH629_05585, partial [Ignavibacteria bacterium]|nr:hypothetical protein [Ignavibacteria bacterium]